LDYLTWGSAGGDANASANEYILVNGKIDFGSRPSSIPYSNRIKLNYLALDNVESNMGN